MVLAKENIHIKGVDFASTQKIEYVKGNENILFSTYAQNYLLLKNALSA